MTRDPGQRFAPQAAGLRFATNRTSRLSQVAQDRAIALTLRPFYFDPLSGVWKELDLASLGGSFMLDTTNNFLTFMVPSSFLLRFQDPTDPTVYTTFFSISGLSVPEPSSVAMLGIGAALVWNRRRRRAAQTACAPA